MDGRAFRSSSELVLQAPYPVELRSAKQASFLKPANVQYGRRCVPKPSLSLEQDQRDHEALVQRQIKPFSKLEEVMKPLSEAPEARGRAHGKAVGQPSHDHGRAIGQAGRPSGGQIRVGQPAALQCGASLPVKVEEKRGIAKGISPQASNSDDFFNLILPPIRTSAPVRAWRALPERPPEKSYKASSVPELHFSPQLHGKSLLRDTLAVSVPSSARFSETLKSGRDRSPQVLRPRPPNFNVTLRELQGMRKSYSIREPHFFFH